MPWHTTTLLGLAHLGLLDAIHAGYLADLALLPLITALVTGLISLIGLSSLVAYVGSFQSRRPDKRDIAYSTLTSLLCGVFYVYRLDVPGRAETISMSLNTSILYVYAVGALLTSTATTIILYYRAYIPHERSETK